MAIRSGSLLAGALVLLAATAAVAEDGAGTFVTVPGVKTLKPPPGVVYVPPAPARVEPDALAGKQVGLVEVGQRMPLEYMMLFDVKRFGLPPPRDGWVYFGAGDEVFRVDLSSRLVLENVTDQVKPRN